MTQNVTLILGLIFMIWFVVALLWEIVKPILKFVLKFRIFKWIWRQTRK